jgi:hypothetical protein
LPYEYQPYPRSLYRRKDGVSEECVFDGVPCEMMDVHSEAQEAEAKKHGWRNSPAEAGEPVTDPVVRKVNRRDNRR